jgi:hypothetical protein
VKKKKLIKELHQFGVTTSYDEFKLFQGSAAAASQDLTKDLFCQGSKIIQAVEDNFDADISSPNGLKQTHCMAIIMTQENISIKNT